MEKKYMSLSSQEYYDVNIKNYIGDKISTRFPIFAPETISTSEHFDANKMQQIGIYACCGKNNVNFPTSSNSEIIAPILIVMKTGIGSNYANLGIDPVWENTKTLTQICYYLSSSALNIAIRYKIPQSSGTYYDWDWSEWIAQQSIATAMEEIENGTY